MFSFLYGFVNQLETYITLIIRILKITQFVYNLLIIKIIKTLIQIIYSPDTVVLNIDNFWKRYSVKFYLIKTLP